MPAEELGEHLTGSAAKVDDGLGIPLEPGDTVDSLRRARLHRAVEDGEAVGVLAHPRLEVGTEHEREGRLARLHRVREAREGFVPFGPELQGKLVPGLVSVPSQQLRRRRVPEDAWLDLLEDAVGGERAQGTLNGVRISVAAHLLDGPR